MKPLEIEEIIRDVEKIERKLKAWQSTGNKSYLIKAIDLTHDLLFVLESAEGGNRQLPGTT